jgi:membrane protease YdiL (CAAX protease family)
VGGIGVAAAVGAVEPSGLVRRNLGGVAALLFVLVPDRQIRAREESWQDYGLPWWGLGSARTWHAWGRGAAVGIGVSLLVLPVFVLALHAGARVAGYPVAFDPRLPPGLALAAVTQLLAVALPEELFYRGWLQSGWARSGPTRRILGAEIGPGFLATQFLFAAGHLVTLQPWRLATFFPGLLFGWLRARTGSVVAPAVVHTLSNLLVLVLDASLRAPP